MTAEQKEPEQKEPEKKEPVETPTQMNLPFEETADIKKTKSPILTGKGEELIEPIPTPQKMEQPEKEQKPAKTKAPEVNFQEVTEDKPLEKKHRDMVDNLIESASQDTLTKMLTDPDSVIQDLESKVLEKIQKKIQNDKNSERFWNKFYQDYRDLGGREEIVNMLYGQYQNHPEWAKLSWQEGSKKLAEEVRAFMKRNGMDLTAMEVDTSNSDSIVVSSSGSPAPSRVTKPVKSQTFVEEIRGFQRRKGSLKTDLI